MNVGRPRILVVDDDPALRRMLTGTLTRWGYDVISVGDGAEALMQFRAYQGEFSAIVSDVDMPGMGGLEFARAVRQAGFEGRVVIMSGRITDGPSSPIYDSSVMTELYVARCLNSDLVAVVLADDAGREKLRHVCRRVDARGDLGVNIPARFKIVWVPHVVVCDGVRSTFACFSGTRFAFTGWQSSFKRSLMLRCG